MRATNSEDMNVYVLNIFNVTERVACNIYLHYLLFTTLLVLGFSIK